MLINQEFINHLTPVEVTSLRICIDSLYKEKVKPDTTNYENVLSHVTCYPHSLDANGGLSDPVSHIILDQLGRQIGSN